MANENNKPTNEQPENKPEVTPEVEPEITPEVEPEEPKEPKKEPKEEPKKQSKVDNNEKEQSEDILKKLQEEVKELRQYRETKEYYETLQAKLKAEGIENDINIFKSLPKLTDEQVDNIIKELKDRKPITEPFQGQKRTSPQTMEEELLEQFKKFDI